MPRDAASRDDGGIASRRAVLRWSLRLFRREWRQQVLILILVTVAVSATILGAAIVTSSPPPRNADFGTANHLVQLGGHDPRLAAELAAVTRQFGRVDVIENRTLTTGTAGGTQLRSQNPRGPFGGPLLALVSGRYPTVASEVALTGTLEQSYGVAIGGTWRAAGHAYHVVGTVENPSSLTESFALVAPGALTEPETVTVLFDATPAQLTAFTAPKGTRGAFASGLESIPPAAGFNPEFIVLAAATFGMLFIGFVAVAGFTVVGQRRTRALGILGALGASDRRIRLVLVADGAALGGIAMVLGAAIGLAAWWVYAPGMQASVGHVIDPAAIPWWLVGVAMALALCTCTFAASRPARAIARLPIVAALSGRPPEPTGARRSAIVGLGVLGAGVALVAAAGSVAGRGGGIPFVMIGIAASCVGVYLVAQWVVAQLGLVANRAPLAARVALRDLARYRSRSGAALGAISLAIVITGVVCIAVTARFSDPYDFVGPNLASNQLNVYRAPVGSAAVVTIGPGGKKISHRAGSTAETTKLAGEIAVVIGARSSLALEKPSAGLVHTAAGRGFTGTIYVATPALLKRFGIAASSIDPRALVLTSRPTLPGASNLALVYGAAWSNPNPQRGGAGRCPPGSCVRNPRVQEVSSLPTGTSAPNTVLTELAVRELHLRTSVRAYELTTRSSLTALQVQSARTLAQTGGATIESASSFPTLNEVDSFAVLLGILLALGVLAMTVGLIRSETASELRVLSAAGANRRTRRALTGVTAGVLGLLGAVLGLVVAYLVTGAFFSSNLSELARDVPVRQLVTVLFGLPLVAGAAGWALAAREPSTLARQPLE